MMLLRTILELVSTFRSVLETKATQSPVTFRNWLRINIVKERHCIYWPVHPTSIVNGPKNIYIGIDVAPGIMPGCYIQAFHGKIYLGDYTQIAANVGIISANHDLYDNRNHIGSIVFVGKYCWLGFSSVILPNVILGDHTIVGANSVVTKSFPDGYCVIAGNPAKIVKNLDKTKCQKYQNNYKYHGLIKDCDYDEYRRKRLNVDNWDEAFSKLNNQ